MRTFVIPFYFRSGSKTGSELDPERTPYPDPVPLCKKILGTTGFGSGSTTLLWGQGLALRCLTA
jgi:hypothetical protein